MASSTAELERAMLRAMRPGQFIRYADDFDFVRDLEGVAEDGLRIEERSVQSARLAKRF